MVDTDPSVLSTYKAHQMLGSVPLLYFLFCCETIHSNDLRHLVFLWPLQAQCTVDVKLFTKVLKIKSIKKDFLQITEIILYELPPFCWSTHCINNLLCLVWLWKPVIVYVCLCQYLAPFKSITLAWLMSSFLSNTSQTPQS